MMSSAPWSLSALDQGRHQRLVAGGQRRDADGVAVVLDRLAGRFLGGLEERADVDVEAEVGQRRGHHLGTAVVAVLAELGDHHARPAALRGGEGVDLVLQVLPFLVHPEGRHRRLRRSSGWWRGTGPRPSPARRRPRPPWPAPGRRGRSAPAGCPGRCGHTRSGRPAPA